MRKKVFIAATAMLVMGNIFLIAFAPDQLSMTIIGFMLAVVCTGVIFGIYPMINYSEGFLRASAALRSASIASDAPVWDTFIELGNIFSNKVLDEMFAGYKKKATRQREADQTINDLREYINEDSVSDRCWHNVISQIPGTLTGFGVLGTFIGLIWGISRIGFNSTEATLESVQTLLSGIHIAFYTSIAGIILSILFNILHRMVWSMTMRNMSMFLDDFHRTMIPTVEEQERYKDHLHREYVLERLERIPRKPSGDDAHAQASEMNERILLPQIINGLKNGEFRFLLSAKHDIHTKQVVSYESILKWTHRKLGAIPSSVFMPIIEKNGLITKINRSVWEDVCRLLSEQNKDGKLAHPVAVNVSKVDILADKGDIYQFFKAMLNKYEFPPRMLDIEISVDAFTEARDVTLEAAEHLRSAGFKVIIDNFRGDFVQLDDIENIPADEIKLSLKDMDINQSVEIIENTFWQACNRAMNVTCEFVKSMEQVKALRDSGCRIAQGNYFSVPEEPEAKRE